MLPLEISIRNLSTGGNFTMEIGMTDTTIIPIVSPIPMQDMLLSDSSHQPSG